MGVITTGAHPKALWPGVKAWTQGAYDKFPTEYTDLFKVEPSSQAWEEYVELTGFGLAAVKDENGAIAYDSEAQGSTTRITNVTYALGFMVTMEEIQDNKYEAVGKRRGARLAFSMRTTKEIVAANLYNRAFNSSYVGGDGKELCATDHPTQDGTQQNELTNAVDLCEAGIEDMLILIGKAKNTKGLQIKLLAQTLHIPPDLEFEAIRILKSVGRVDSANNDINAIRTNGSIPGGYKVNHYFTDTDAWFIRTNCPDQPVCLDRYRSDLEQDNDFDTKNARASYVERYAFGWPDWRAVFGSPGA